MGCSKSKPKERQVFVFGATGKVGFSIAEELLLKDNHPRVTLGVRAKITDVSKQEKLKKLTDLHAIREIIDGSDISSMSEKLKNHDCAVIITPIDNISFGLNAVTACRASKVSHIVLVSVVEHSGVFSEKLKEIERKVVEGKGMTIVRCMPFMENYEGMKGEFEEGVMRLPMKKAAVAPIAVRDIAMAIGEIVVNPEKHVNRVYNLTGPESLSGEKIATNLGRGLGVDIKYVDQPIEEFKKNLIAWKLPQITVDGLVDLYKRISEDKLKATTEDFRVITGRDGTRLVDWAASMKSTFKLEKRPPKLEPKKRKSSDSASGSGRGTAPAAASAPQDADSHSDREESASHSASERSGSDRRRSDSGSRRSDDDDDRSGGRSDDERSGGGDGSGGGGGYGDNNSDGGGGGGGSGYGSRRGSESY
eukprot:comp21040_c0_seq1/m.44196 comp21040_c0_seq1/g.44196  ORF comp21040_c0_seq1/g.44196 comp21040_c0_seq1/m.44196 type:complete len:420 (+) comp21040_c0_seq1:60-1319(+)